MYYESTYMGLFASKEEKLERLLNELEVGGILSFSTPDNHTHLDIYSTQTGYEIVSRQTQVVGKAVVPGYDMHTKSIVSDVIYIENSREVFDEVEGVMMEVQRYRAMDKKYFSAHHTGWATEKVSCVPIPEMGILIPKKSTELCPQCRQPGLSASARGRLHLYPPTSSGPMWSSGKYFVCFNCRYFQATYPKLGSLLEITCHVCKREGRNGQMHLRKGRNGIFWGCKNYPNCKHTLNLSEWEADLVFPKEVLNRL